MAALILIRRITKTSSSIITSHLCPPTIPNLLSSSLVSRRCIASKLFVGGLSFHTTEKTLAEAFSQYGQVIEAKIVQDRVSERSKGFGYVTFASDDEAVQALTGMNGNHLQGRAIYVDIAKPKIVFRSDMPIARGPPDNK